MIEFPVFASISKIFNFTLFPESLATRPVSDINSRTFENFRIFLSL